MKKNRASSDQISNTAILEGAISEGAISEGAILEGALADWKTRNPSVGHLNADRRQALKGQVYEQMASPTGPVAAWSPALRWVLALGLPALAIFSVLSLERLNPEPKTYTSASFVQSTHSTEIQVSKEDGQIVFRVANAQLRQVVKSSRPDGSDAGAALAIQDGRFSDSLQSGGSLTFYRID